MEPPRPPTREDRLKAALALAGLPLSGDAGWITLAERIATPGYGYKTLKNMADPENTTTRAPTDTDLYVIGRACGVSEAFWTVDFAQLGEADVRALLNETRAELAGLSRTVADLSRQLAAIRDQRRRGGSEEGGQQ